MLARRRWIPHASWHAWVDSWVGIWAESGRGVAFVGTDRAGRSPGWLVARPLAGLCTPDRAGATPSDDTRAGRGAWRGRWPGDWPCGLFLDCRVVDSFRRLSRTRGPGGPGAVRGLDGDSLCDMGLWDAPWPVGGLGLLCLAGCAVCGVAVLLAQSLSLYAAAWLRRGARLDATGRTGRRLPRGSRGGGLGRGRGPGADSRGLRPQGAGRGCGRASAAPDVRLWDRAHAGPGRRCPGFPSSAGGHRPAQYPGGRHAELRETEALARTVGEVGGGRSRTLGLARGRCFSVSRLAPLSPRPRARRRPGDAWPPGSHVRGDGVPSAGGALRVQQRLPDRGGWSRAGALRQGQPRPLRRIGARGKPRLVDRSDWRHRPSRSRGWARALCPVRLRAGGGRARGGGRGVPGPVDLLRGHSPGFCPPSGEPSWGHRTVRQRHHRRMVWRYRRAVGAPCPGAIS